VTKDLQIKLTDFGMSKVLSNADSSEYFRTDKGPIKWMAPESIKAQLFSKSSDIWSVGIALIELWCNGREPFEKLSNLQVIDHYREEPPTILPDIPDPVHIPPEIQTLILECFKDLSHRPTAVSLKDQLYHTVLKASS
jgi:serine/threonine protein kinase